MKNIQKSNKDTNDDPNDEINIVTNPLLRALLLVGGTISLGLGIIGIALPLLPTTPFLLLAAACYSRSSEKFYLWLMNNRVFGSYIRNYREGKGIPIKVKISAVLFLWATILLSVFLVVDILYVRIALVVIAFLVSMHILKLPTLVKVKKG